MEVEFLLYSIFSHNLKNIFFLLVLRLLFLEVLEALTDFLPELDHYCTCFPLLSLISNLIDPSQRYSCYLQLPFLKLTPSFLLSLFPQESKGLMSWLLRLFILTKQYFSLFSSHPPWNFRYWQFPEWFPPNKWQTYLFLKLLWK